MGRVWRRLGLVCRGLNKTPPNREVGFGSLPVGFLFLGNHFERMAGYFSRLIKETARASFRTFLLFGPGAISFKMKLFESPENDFRKNSEATKFVNFHNLRRHYDWLGLPTHLAWSLVLASM